MHIHRGQDWVELAPDERISLEAWQTFVAQDPDFRLDCFAEAETPSGDVICAESPGLAVWTAYEPPGGGQAWFDWYEGRVVVKSPDDAILGKMRDVARALDARVQGDEGEFYDDGPGAPVSPSEKRSGFFGRLFGRG